MTASSARDADDSLNQSPVAGGPELRDKDFKDLCALIFAETGIALNDSKREMLCSRLGKRLRHHSFGSYREYYDYLQNHDRGGNERRHMVNCITTNKTDFFRESYHFDFLRNTVFPQMEERAVQSGPRRLRVWCAASSTGEEPYTLAMTVREWADACRWDVRILASDIDTDVLARAEAGIYAEDRIDPVPAPMRPKYFLRGTGTNQGSVAVHPDLRELLTFRRINLMDDPWPIRARFDVIFCRNVIIYFNQETQRRLLQRFAACLQPNGYLFLGHSENLHWLSDLYTPLGNTIYQLRSADLPQAARRPPSTPRRPASPPAPPRRPPSTPRRPPSLPTGKAPQADIIRRGIIVGEVFASDQPACVSTLLGSCVAACLYDPVAQVGGMNHFMLPEGDADESASARYGIHAMELLINDIMKLGGDRRRLQAKIFGGGRVVRAASKVWNVSEKNVHFAKRFLETEHIPITSKCLGGKCGMQVRFMTHTGQAFVRPLDGSSLENVAEQEERYGREIISDIIKPHEEQVTLF